MARTNWNYVKHLKDYCSNCTLPGFSYIANQNLHLIERIFWLICVVLSAIGAYLLISQYQRDFNSRAVSIVSESLPRNHKLYMPTIAVCDLHNKLIKPDDLIDFVNELDRREKKEYSFNIEMFINFLVYPYIYREDNIKDWCSEECNDGCAMCPAKDLRHYHKRFMTNCSEFFVYCEFSLKPFDCCTYFRPLTTPQGNCFMLNSILNNNRQSPNWFKNEVVPMKDTAKFKFVTKKPTELSVMNEEDVPHSALPGYKVQADRAGQDKTFHIFRQTTKNDHEVREIAPAFRQCRFPDELLENTAYRAYSFSTCFFDCLLAHQRRECNCSAFNFMPEPNDRMPECDLKGFLCLENYTLIRPNARNLLRWTKSNYSCECLPSCTESEFKIVYDHQIRPNKSNPYMTITVAMPKFATERYRRKALRNRLDIVVSFGGILGLFLGASILSGIEIIYYFTVRLYNNYRMERSQRNY